MWMTLATPTMPGWRQWPSTSMTQVAKRFHLICSHFRNLEREYSFHRLGSYLCRQGMMLEQYSGCLSAKRCFTTHEWWVMYFCERFSTLDYAQVILYASHKDFVEKVVEKLEAHWWSLCQSDDLNGIKSGFNCIDWNLSNPIQSNPIRPLIAYAATSVSDGVIDE